MLPAFLENDKSSSEANRMVLKSRVLTFNGICEVHQLYEIRNDSFATIVLGSKQAVAPKRFLSIFAGLTANAWPGGRTFAFAFVPLYQCLETKAVFAVPSATAFHPKRDLGYTKPPKQPQRLRR